MIARLAKALLLATLPMYQIACAQDVPMTSVPDSFRYLEYENGKVVRESTIKKGDSIYEALVRVLRDNQTDWAIDGKTYAPHKYFISDSLTVVCNKDLMVMNYRRSGDKWVQVSKEVKDCESKLSVY